MNSYEITLAISPFIAFFIIIAIGFGFAHYFDVKGQ